MFKPPSPQRSVKSLVLFFSVMTVVLSLLAFLQYRWISEVGDAEERRLKENLNLSTSRFADDFQETIPAVGCRIFGQRNSLAVSISPANTSGDTKKSGQRHRHIPNCCAMGSF